MRRKEKTKRRRLALQLELAKVNAWPAVLELGQKLGKYPPLSLRERIDVLYPRPRGHLMALLHLVRKGN